VVIVALAIIVGICLNFPVPIPGSPCGNKGLISGTALFTGVYNKPHLLIAALSEYKVDDRKLLEHALQIAVAESAAGANSQLEARLRNFLDKYDFINYYEVRIRKEGKTIMEFDIIPEGRLCGEKNEGLCFFDPDSMPCDVGMVQIDKANNECYDEEKCCKYVNEMEYRQEVEKVIGEGKAPKVVHCGDYGNGICSQQRCDGFITFELPDKTCKDAKVNNGKTPHCCTLRTPEVLGQQFPEIAQSAWAPIYYNGDVGDITITISD
jgi:hypothetical protein